MKVKAKIKQDMVFVKLLAQHPMETGFRKNKETGETIPAKFIQELTCVHNEKTVFIANLVVPCQKIPTSHFLFQVDKKVTRCH